MLPTALAPALGPVLGGLYGWSSTGIVAPILAGAVLIGALLVVEGRTDAPIVDLQLFHDRLFAATNVLVTLTMTAFFGVLYLVPLFYQDGRGLSALGSGLGTFPEAIGVLLGAQVVSRFLDPVIGPRRLMASGLVGIVVTSLMALTGAHTSLWWMRVLILALGYCIPHVMMSMQAAAFATIRSESTGRASTLFNARRQLGGALGVALLSTVVAAFGPTRVLDGRVVAHLTAYHAAFLVAGGVALLGSVTALVLVHDADAVSTMVRRRARPGTNPTFVQPSAS